MFEIEIINALDDNYIYLIQNKKKNLTAVIDPGESKSVINLLQKRNLSLDQIFNTHLITTILQEMKLSLNIITVG